ETTLHSFTGSDGINPGGDVVVDSLGNVYGVALNGGSFGYGTVYKVDTSGVFSVLHAFSGSPDGAHPTAGLLLDSAGNLYGTTAMGGAQTCKTLPDCGVVFKLDSSGNYSIPLSFNGKGGADPITPLVEDNRGNLYGVTQRGGGGGCALGAGCGVLFRLGANGKEIVLHTFGLDPSDGIYPNALLLRGRVLYGTTLQGGTSGGGTVFQFTLP